jgi:hypothetical protein
MLLLLQIPFSGPSLAAQDDEFREWKGRERSGFKKFKDEHDREFAEYLRSQWKEFDSFRGIKRDNKPKPVVIAPVRVAAPSKPAEVPRQPPTLVEVPSPAVPPPMVVVLPVPPATPKLKSGVVSYYGHTLTISYEPAFAIPLTGKPGPDSISNYWTALGTVDFAVVLRQLYGYRDTLHLNDWGYADLVRGFSRTIHPASENDERLLSWFLLTKSGFQTRVAYDEQRIHLFLTSDQKIYETKYLTMQGHSYYAMLAKDRGANLGKVFTYDREYPGTVRPLDIRLTSFALTTPVIEYRELQFEYGTKRYKLRVPYDRRIVEFLDTYPQTDLDWYFSAAVGAATRAVLIEELRTVIKDLNERDSLNLLLRFVQTAFLYKTDGDQFGHENYLFVEETLHYPYSDCEDRSVLYAWLVRQVMGVEVVGLSYPGHVATAVRLTSAPASAATLEYEGKSYVIADPTYIGADVGMVMPKFANTKPQVIRIQ